MKELLSRMVTRAFWLVVISLPIYGLSRLHINWVVFFEYLRANRVSLSLYGSVFLTAVIVTMPEDPPQNFKDCWTWSRNALSKHFNLQPKPTSSITEAVTVTTDKTVDPAKDAAASPKV